MNDRLSRVISELASDLESVRRIPRLRWVAADGERGLALAARRGGTRLPAALGVAALILSWFLYKWT